MYNVTVKISDLVTGTVDWPQRPGYGPKNAGNNRSDDPDTVPRVTNFGILPQHSRLNLFFQAFPARQCPIMLLQNRYKIIEELGKGGFGKTYLAEDQHHPKRQQVVVKELLPPEEIKNFELVRDRFEKEGERLAALAKGSGGGIPEFHAYFSESDRYYIVQEFIEGGSLGSKLKNEGPFSQEFVLELIKGILPILEYIHTQPNPIIHRDIKPDNIMWRSDTGQPVLIDFGIVKEVTQVDTQGHPTSTMLAGTPGYMPMEQAIGRPVLSSDLYSLGMTAIVLMTGKNPKDMASPLTDRKSVV